MAVWGPAILGAVLAVMGWAAAFGMLRAQVQGVRRDLERLIATVDRMAGRQEDTTAKMSNLSSDLAVLAALANVKEHVRHLRGSDP